MPPQDTEAEQSVLGSALLSRDALDEMAAILQPEDFYQDTHQIIWTALLAMREGGRPVDAVTLMDQLRADGQADRIGGATYLSHLARSVPTAANAMYYARIVRERAARRELIQAGTRIVAQAYEATLDADGLIAEAQRLVNDATMRSAHGGRLTNLGQVAIDHWRYLEETRHEPNVLGLQTGFQALDGVLGGFPAGDLIVLAGRPSMGKSSLALAIAANVARQGTPVAFFSLETSATQIAERLVCMAAGVDNLAVRTRSLSDYEWDKAMHEAIHGIGPLPLWIEDRGGITTADVLAESRPVKELGLIVVDYLGLLQDRPTEGETYANHVGRMARHLKGTARELRVPLLLLAQLNREIEKRGGEPHLSDLRDSGHIEQDTDADLMLWRDPENENIVRVKIAKQRNGPAGFSIELFWDAKHTRFADLERRRTE